MRLVDSDKLGKLLQIEAFSHFLSGLLAPSLLSTHSLSSLISLLTLIDLLT